MKKKDKDKVKIDKLDLIKEIRKPQPPATRIHKDKRKKSRRAEKQRLIKEIEEELLE